jgi:hypothetical protein
MTPVQIQIGGIPQIDGEWRSLIVEEDFRKRRVAGGQCEPVCPGLTFSIVLNGAVSERPSLASLASLDTYMVYRGGRRSGKRHDGQRRQPR